MKGLCKALYLICLGGAFTTTQKSCVLQTNHWKFACKLAVVRYYERERNVSRAIGSNKRLARARDLHFFRVEMEFWRRQCQKFFQMKQLPPKEGRK